MEYLHILFTSLGSVIVLFILTKLMGYRQMSQMSMFDYINGITIGSIAAEMAISLEDDFRIPLTAMIVYGAVAVFLSWIADRYMCCHRMIVGTPYILFQNDAFLYQNMKRAKINVSEFLTASRGAGYFDLSQLQCAILEPNGQISFLPKAADRPATPTDLEIQPQEDYAFANIIMDGQVMKENLKAAGRDMNWLRKQMEAHGIASEKEVLLATCNPNDDCYFFEKDPEKKCKDFLD